ncbi:glycosylated lysosomal membrane protein-like [Oratosquilla oratoria]|uniref:glycosylated lysosomal membrane protein-like n=1 Tax=Oratosquilla oratoria TaxID=337810 RepID=UPI003F770CC7
MAWKYFQFSFILILINVISGRKVSLSINPGCEEYDYPHLVQVKAEGSNDTIIHLWSIWGSPVFLVAKAQPNATVTVQCEDFIDFKPKSVVIDPEPDYVFGIVFTQLLYFDDSNDTGKIDNIPIEDQIPFHMKRFTWDIDTLLNESIEEAGISMKAIEYNGITLKNTTKFSIKLTAYGVDGRSSILPHLLRTFESAQLDFVLDDLTWTEFPPPHPVFENPRYAFAFQLFSTENLTTDSSIEYMTRKSLDDENTPGVFNLDEITTPLARKSSKGGYMQWRPVSYLTPKRDINDATNVKVDGGMTILNKTDEYLSNSLAYGMFGNELSMARVAATKLVIGRPKDGYYSKYNYATWTVALGYGAPPLEGFSLLVIMVIGFGVGIPLVLFLAGGVFFLVKRLRRDNELLLN